MIIGKLVSFFIKKLLRRFYWLFNLSKITGISSANIHFPVIVEGKGTIQVGSKTLLDKNSSIKITKEANLLLGKQSHLGCHTDIRIGSGGSLIVGHELLIEQASRLFINSSWKFGNRVKIATHCAIFSRESEHYGQLYIGDGTHIGDNAIIDVSDNVTIGNEVAIGPNCTVYTHDHNYTNTAVAAWKGGIIKNPVIIKDGAWIGSGVTLLPGVTIGERAVIAAGSMVTKSVPPNTIWGGVPAKQIKEIKT